MKGGGVDRHCKTTWPIQYHRNCKGEIKCTFACTGVIRIILKVFLKTSKKREEKLLDCVTEFVVKKRTNVFQVTLPKKDFFHYQGKICGFRIYPSHTLPKEGIGIYCG